MSSLYHCPKCGSEDIVERAVGMPEMGYWRCECLNCDHKGKIVTEEELSTESELAWIVFEILNDADSK